MRCYESARHTLCRAELQAGQAAQQAAQAEQTAATETAARLQRELDSAQVSNMPFSALQRARWHCLSGEVRSEGLESD